MAMATAMATAAEGQRRSDDPPEYSKTARAGGKYRADGSKTEDSADESTNWGGEYMEELALKEKSATATGVGEARHQLTLTEGDQRKMVWTANTGEQRPAGVTPATPTLRPPTRQERGVAMGQEPQQGQGLPAGRKTQ